MPRMRRGSIDPETGKFLGVIKNNVAPKDVEKHRKAGYEEFFDDAPVEPSEPAEDAPKATATKKKKAE